MFIDMWVSCRKAYLCRHAEVQLVAVSQKQVHGLSSTQRIFTVASAAVWIRYSEVYWLLSMPRELITVQVGQCGNQIGCRFWELALREQAAYNPGGVYDDAISSFFKNVDQRYEPPM